MRVGLTLFEDALVCWIKTLHIPSLIAEFRTISCTCCVSSMLARPGVLNSIDFCTTIGLCTFALARKTGGSGDAYLHYHAFLR